VISREAETIVSPSPHLEKKIISHTEKCSTTVIPNGFSPERFHPAKKEKIILLVGRLLKFKGFQYFLQAIKDMDLGEYKVYIVGEGTYKPQLDIPGQEVGSDGVRFLGWVYPDRLRNLYEHTSIFVMTSEVENSPITLLEAMAAKAAIITTDIEACRFLVGDCAVYVPPREPDQLKKALVSMMRDQELRTSLANKGRDRVEHHLNWKKIGTRYESVLDEVANP